MEESSGRAGTHTETLDVLETCLRNSGKMRSDELHITESSDRYAERFLETKFLGLLLLIGAPRQKGERKRDDPLQLGPYIPALHRS